LSDDPASTVRIRNGSLWPTLSRDSPLLLSGSALKPEWSPR
jgi:hypothetical protein